MSKKISTKFIELLRANELKDYTSQLDFDKSIADMNLSQKTIGILSIIHKKYWCNTEQRKSFEEKLKQNEIEYQKELSEKYSTEILFKKSELEKTVSDEVTDLIVYENTRWYKKIFDKILHFLNKK